MDDQAATEKLAAALDNTATGLWMGQHGPGWGAVIAAALLQTVRDLVADELRATAEAIDRDTRVDDARQRGQAQRAVGEARSVVLERADALTGRTT